VLSYVVNASSHRGAREWIAPYTELPANRVSRVNIYVHTNRQSNHGGWAVLSPSVGHRGWSPISSCVEPISRLLIVGSPSLFNRLNVQSDIRVRLRSSGACETRRDPMTADQGNEEVFCCVIYLVSSFIACGAVGMATSRVMMSSVLRAPSKFSISFHSLRMPAAATCNMFTIGRPVNKQLAHSVWGGRMSYSRTHVQTSSHGYALDRALDCRWTLDCLRSAIEYAWPFGVPVAAKYSYRAHAVALLRDLQAASCILYNMWVAIYQSNRDAKCCCDSVNERARSLKVWWVYSRNVEQPGLRRPHRGDKTAELEYGRCDHSVATDTSTDVTIE